MIRPLVETITPLRERPILEVDERWSYVGAQAEKVWIGLALERHTCLIQRFLGELCEGVAVETPASSRQRVW